MLSAICTTLHFLETEIKERIVRSVDQISNRKKQDRHYINAHTDGSPYSILFRNPCRNFLWKGRAANRHDNKKHRITYQKIHALSADNSSTAYSCHCFQINPVSFDIFPCKKHPSEINHDQCINMGKHTRNLL